MPFSSKHRMYKNDLNNYHHDVVADLVGYDGNRWSVVHRIHHGKLVASAILENGKVLHVDYPGSTREQKADFRAMARLMVGMRDPALSPVPSTALIPPADPELVSQRNYGSPAA